MVLQVLDHEIIRLFVIQESLIEHCIVVVLIVVLYQLLLLEGLCVFSYLLDVSRDLHRKSVSSLDIGVIVLENGPELDNVLG